MPNLTDSMCRAAKPKEKPYKLADSGQLYLFVAPTGRRTWRLDAKIRDKRATLTLGDYPVMGLAAARAARDKAKVAIRDGVDPRAPVGSDGAPPVQHSFRDVAGAWFKANEAKWVPSYSIRLWSRLRDDAFPDLGEKDVSAITPSEVLAALRKIEDRNAIEMAKRVRFAISAVFRFAIAEGKCSTDPTAALNVALKAAPEPKRRVALPTSELGDFMLCLDRYAGARQTALGVKLIVHTAVRTAELRLAEWSEFHEDSWAIPGSRMKMSKDHLVPLTPQARGILAELRDLSGGSRWLLPGERGYKPVSENTLLYALYRMGYHSRASIHGFRATFSTIANESGLWSPDAIERQLAHVPQNQVRSAYNRAEYLPERARLMAWWSDYLDAAERKAFQNDFSDLLAAAK